MTEKVLLTDLLDFIGLDGIVKEEYRERADYLCKRINKALDGAEHKERP